MLKRWIPAAALCIAILLVWSFGLQHYASLEELKAQRSALLGVVAMHPVLSAVGFTTIYATAVMLSLPVATPLTLLGGFLFGRWLGTALTVVAATLGAVAVFLAARTSLGRTLRDKAGPLYKRAEAGMKDHAVGYMLFLRLVPLFPFFLVNILPALFNVRLATFAATTLVGIIPGTFVFANAGRQLGTIESASGLLSPATLGSLALLGLLALLPVAAQKLRARKGFP